jgi:hypothetical protein
MLKSIPHEHLYRLIAPGYLQCRCGKVITVRQWLDDK